LLAIEENKATVKVVCINCNKAYNPKETIVTCAVCGGLLEIQHPLESLREIITPDWINQRRTARNFPSQSGVWRWRELVAPFPDEAIVTRGEGNTFLYEDERLAEYSGLHNVWLKHEGENPTGSFKDRGMTVGVSHAKWVGAKMVACASSGNTSASLASYAARAGMKALTFIPAGKITYGKLSQAMAYGSKTIQVEGTFDTALDLVRQLAREKGVYLVNSINPFRLEGQKTTIFELFDQLDWNIPDWIVVSGGNLGNSSSFGKALWELRELGLIRKLPRIAIIQAEGASPFYNYYRNDFHDFQAIQPDTIASAINIGNPVSVPKAVRAIELTNGLVEKVSDAEIMQAKVQLDRSGIGGEPAAAAPLAGVKKLTAQGIINPNDKVVCILTGHILKDADNIINYHTADNGALPFANPPLKIKGTLAEVEALLEG
jgi:threonine synthase